MPNNGLVTEPDGTKCWYLSERRHRVDGPAVEWADGSKAWYLNGELHRTDGPAVEWSSGNEEWWLNDRKLTRDEVKTLKFLQTGSVKQVLEFTETILPRYRNEDKIYKRPTVPDRKLSQ